MTSEVIKLTDRAIIEITGKDRKQFLQGLITNDILQLRPKSMIYAFMLSNKGRFLYDFFILCDENDEKIYLDCIEERADEIIKKLSFYKLRADVAIRRDTEIQILWSSNALECNKSRVIGAFQDPRHQNMGLRIYGADIEQNIAQNQDQSLYHLARIKNLVPEGEYDLTFDKSLILEFGFDNLNAISYDKGCYVGQELTARTHHLGQIRKRVYLAEISNIDEIFSSKEIKKVANQTNLLKNSEICYDNKPVGIILSVVRVKNKILFLALIKESNGKSLASSDLISFRGHQVKLM